MKLQNIIYPRLNICTEEQLYFRRNDNAFYTWTNDHILMNVDGIIDFDTYFSAFSIEKWSKYTNIGKLNLVLNVKGFFRITLMRKDLYKNQMMTEFVHEQMIDTGGEVKMVSLPFNSVNKGGIYCFKLHSLRNDSYFYSGYYSTDVPEEVVRNVKIGIDICTYKREEFVHTNVENLFKAHMDNPNSPLYKKLEVFISDNGNTLKDDILLGDGIHVFYNKNVGGAGGFTRGMIEIAKRVDTEGFTHALLMDDDIIVETEVLLRTFSILSLLKENYSEAFVGGAMLRRDFQAIQIESGAVWNDGNIVGFKRGVDLRDLRTCIFNEIEEGAQYNAWWYCVIPVTKITTNNLPMPIFIRGDDVEYGLRNTRQLILMNGLCVWHEPFENKYSSFLYYYILRNQLIDNALHSPGYSKRAFLKDFVKRVVKEISFTRYANATLLMNGVEDYLKGVDWLKEQDGAALHKEVMGIGYKLQEVSELGIPFLYGVYQDTVNMPVPENFKLKRLLTVNGLLIRAKRTTIVPTVEAHAVQFYGAKHVLNYDYASKKGFVTHKEPKEIRRLLCRLFSVAGNASRSFYAVNKEYRERMGELTNIDFWNRYLELDSEQYTEKKAVENSARQEYAEVCVGGCVTEATGEKKAAGNGQPKPGTPKKKKGKASHNGHK